MKHFKASKTIWATLAILLGVIAIQSWTISKGSSLPESGIKTIPVTVENDAGNAAQTDFNQSATTPQDPFDLWNDDDLLSMADPFEEMKRMHEHMQKMMDIAMADIGGFHGFDLKSNEMEKPVIRMMDKGDFFRISIEVPGGDEPEIKTELSGDQMTITSHLRASNEQENQKNGSRSRSFRQEQYTQILQFPQNIDPSTLTSHYEDKVLILEIRKAEK